ncbi:hypothetical protein HPP92_010200 [Vanilla planifolia]|uniref:Uncharacterized protein n=1 Tax=Vanilla planifolia TaxID=51239 RepID=A0A835R370_VANPL|nr:hypothetical protein HPP92_010200 [Vanilla planifolia]
MLRRVRVKSERPRVDEDELGGELTRGEEMEEEEDSGDHWRRANARFGGFSRCEVGCEEGVGNVGILVSYV